VEDRQPLDRALADELDEPLARLARVPHAVDGVDHAGVDADDRLDREEVPIAACAPLIRPPLLEVLERLERDVHPHVRCRGLERLGDLAAGRSASAISTAMLGQDPLRPSTPERVDDVDLAVGQHVAGDLGGLDRARQRAGDVDRDDRLGAVGERRLVGVLELAGDEAAVLGNGASGATIRSQNAFGRQLDAGLERLVPKLTSSGTISMPSAAALPDPCRSGIGEDRDALTRAPPSAASVRLLRA
jgi:hypothetical protein